MFQFLGDPHLTISHVNYKLDQVTQGTNDYVFYKCDSLTELLLFLNEVSAAVSLRYRGGGNYKVTEGKKHLMRSL